MSDVVQQRHKPSVSISSSTSASSAASKVALKLLRLSRPRLTSPKLLLAPTSPASENYYTDPSPLLLTLPTQFGTLYVGETFRCILALDSEDTTDVQLVELSAQVSTPNKEHPIQLLRDTEPKPLEPQQSIQQIIEFETHEPGIHVVSASVSYTRPDAPPNMKATYSKTYRFTAEQGLFVRTKISALGPGQCALEAQIENITDSTLTLETTEFLAPAGWISTSIGKHDSEAPALLMPKETWQFCFLVRHDLDYTEQRQVIGMGKFSVSWTREFLGEKGWLMTGHLKRNPGMQ